jgi:putative ATP-dependent endonuclease of OLD family
MVQSNNKQPVAKYPGKVFLADNAEDIKSKKYIERFLDATKSNMLFSKGIILVEGLAEQLIIPCLSESIQIPLDEKHISVIQVGNRLPVFEHFCKMFGVGIQNDNSKYALTTRLACIVDTDPAKIDRSKKKPRWKKCWPYEKEDGIEYCPITKSIAEFKEKITQNSTTNVNIFYNNTGKGKTFEYDLAFENPDSELLKNVTDEIALDDEIEDMIKNSVLSSDDQIKAIFATKYLISVESSKGEAGLNLSHKLKQNNEKNEETRIPFVLPNHVSKAIKWACGEVIQNE